MGSTLAAEAPPTHPMSPSDAVHRAAAHRAAGWTDAARLPHGVDLGEQPQRQAVWTSAETAAHVRLRAGCGAAAARAPP